uniref:Uncharacterized protein n=1 Tax=Rhizophora mucronata TaxID=61149 RepID=A0A2P2J3U8_RHIMU
MLRTTKKVWLYQSVALIDSLQSSGIDVLACD